MKQILLISIGMIFLLAGCAPATLQPPTDEPGMNNPASSETPPPAQNGNATPAGAEDPNQPRENAYLDSMELLTMESYPLQFSLALKGALPTPCHKLKVNVAPPDAQNKIRADVYSISDPNMVCAQVLQPFEENFPLGSFPAGHYTLWVNGKQVAEFDA